MSSTDPPSGGLARWLVAATIMLTVLYAASIGLQRYEPPVAVPVPDRLGPFLGLAFAHAALYAGSRRIRGDRRRVLPYFLVQAALVFALGVVSANQPIILFLYVALTAEAVAVTEDRWGLTPILAGAGALYVVNHAVVSGVGRALIAFLLLAMMAVLVLLVGRARSAVSRRRVDALLRDLDGAHRQLSAFARQAEATALTDERQRIARELHDTLAQGLVGLTLQLEAADSHLARDGAARAREIVQQAMTRARRTLAESRTAIHDLRAAPGADTLAGLIHDEVERFGAATGLACQVHAGVEADDLDGDVRDHVVRILGEALTNIARHARATRVDVFFQRTGHRLELTVQDDGAGFAPDARPDSPGHYGLLGMRERARAVHGRLDIESAPGRGTTVRLALP